MQGQSEQLQLDFNRGAKLWILRRVSELNLITPRMLMVLRAIDDRARDQAETEATLAELGAYSGQSRDTAKRGVADLVRNQLLIRKPVVNGGGVQANRYQIAWGQLQAMADGEPWELIKTDPKPAATQPAESAQVVKAAMGQMEPAPGHSAPAAGAQCPTDPGHSAPAILYAPLRKNNLPSFPGSSWERVVAELIDLGLGAPQAAISRAQASGCSPADLMGLIHHARSKPGAWGPGAVFHRITAALPGGDPAAGWPKPSAEWQQRQIRQAQQQQIQQTAQQAAQRQAERQARRERNQRLIDQYGAILDDLSDAERVELAQTISRHLASRLRINPADYRLHGCRMWLLDALKKQDAESCLKGMEQ